MSRSDETASRHALLHISTVDSLETIRYIAFAKSLTDYAVIDLTGDTINAYEFNKPITLKKKYTEGVLNSSPMERDQGQRR